MTARVARQAPLQAIQRAHTSAWNGYARFLKRGSGLGVRVARICVRREKIQMPVRFFDQICTLK